LEHQDPDKPVSKKERRSEKSKRSGRDRSRSRSRGELDDDELREQKKKRRRSEENHDSASATSRIDSKKERKRDRHIDLDQIDSGPVLHLGHSDDIANGHLSEKPLSPRDVRHEKRSVMRDSLEAAPAGTGYAAATRDAFCEGIGSGVAAAPRKADRWGNDGFFELEETAKAARAAAEERRRAKQQHEQELRYVLWILLHSNSL
jgi:hypothetical protein